MASPNIYTEVNFKNQPVFSGTISDSTSALPKKITIHKHNPGFPMLLLALLIFFQLLAILFSVTLIIFFQMYSDLLEEKNTMKQLNHTKLDCRRNHSSVEGKVWSCCPKNWKPFSSDCYFTSTDLASWNKSEEKCSSMGAHLLVIHSQEEQDFITKTLDTSSAYYMRLSDPEGHGQWQWVDQTPYNQTAMSWRSDEPHGNQGFCVVLNYHPNLKGWGWSDVPCDGDHRFVCEMRQLYL
ncbi:C-type lectin domain family 4 member A-like [Psammomys obesus]|uniref:C-type lectin domain family 4 member A-like n=1 Tax=Psammomys obesus TaxID=48139 RepID=UPI002452E106|nr:C-type lectin domain family 4 member A-like [Psammomys obesus]